MLSITGLGLKDFSDLLKSLGFVLKTEKILGDIDTKEINTNDVSEEKEIFLTYEEEGEKFRVFVRKEKRLRNEKKKNERTIALKRKSRLAVSTKNKSIIKKKSIDPDSPFASLKLLLKN